MRICIFEDQRVGLLEPVNSNRPTFELLCGWTSLYEKQIRQFPSMPKGVLVRPALAELYRLQCPDVAVNEPDWLWGEPVILVNSRWLPPHAFVDLSFPSVGMCAGEPALVAVGPDQTSSLPELGIDECLASWQSTLPQVPVAGQMIRFPWDLVEWNAEQIRRDYEDSTAADSIPAADGAWSVVGPQELISIDPSAQVEPHVVFDTRTGPVIVEQEAVVAAFSRLQGPCVVGPLSQVLGARIRTGTTLGPSCRVGGEVEASIIQGHSNKYHDGFLGHSYVGEWVNLGAGTSNSDLRNDYGEVTVTVCERPVATGLRKVGCFLGDHTKTGLNVAINTGTSAGIFCNLLPSAGFPPRCIPSYSNWYHGVLTDNTDLERLLRTAEQAMQRRGRTLSEAHRTLYRHLHEQSAQRRRTVIRNLEQQRLRRSA